jgi:hypothetical protein
MNNFQINPEYKPVEDPIKSSHDLKTTRESIKQLLADGTPDWIRFPEDYKAFVKESFQEEKEISDSLVAQYRMDDQELLTDQNPRMINILTTIEFYKRLKNNGVRCFTVDNGMAGTVALWAIPKFTNEAKYIAFLQVPCMYEWSVLRLDRHGLPNGEDYRGWRTVLCQLILKDVLTEEEAHRIYGKPLGAVSRRYQSTLYNFRNGIGRNADSNEL